MIFNVKTFILKKGSKFEKNKSEAFLNCGERSLALSDFQYFMRNFNRLVQTQLFAKKGYLNKYTFLFLFLLPVEYNE